MQISPIPKFNSSILREAELNEYALVLQITSKILARVRTQSFSLREADASCVEQWCGVVSACTSLFGKGSRLGNALAGVLISMRNSPDSVNYLVGLEQELINILILKLNMSAAEIEALRSS